MKKIKSTFLFIIVGFSSFLFAECAPAAYNLFEKAPMIQQLDALFISSHPTQNEDAFFDAGFRPLQIHKKGHPIVASHPAFPGLIFKLFLDTSPPKHGLTPTSLWILRILGAEQIRELISQQGWDHLFTVPKKWIYFCDGASILVEEEIIPLNEWEPWKNARVTPEFLDALYFILTKIGLRDCSRPKNIPWTQEGKMAFIDTQTWYEWPIPYYRLSYQLTPPMRSYWEEITSPQ